MKNSMICVMSFVVTLLLLPICKYVALTFGIVDCPNASLKLHKQPTPYLGGIAILGGIIISMSWYCAYFSWSLILGGLLLIAAVGLYDDTFSIPPASKLCWQLLSACLLIGVDFFTINSTSMGLLRFLQIWWIASMMNAWNLIDIMDGLAGTVAIWSLFGIAVVAVFFNDIFAVLLSFATIGAVSAFLTQNLPPARIFMGDAGSQLLGAIIGYLTSTIWFANGCTFDLFMIVGFLCALALGEQVCLIAIRMIKGFPFYHGSRDHFVHYQQRMGFSTKQILLLVQAIQFLFISMSLSYLYGYVSFFGTAVFIITFCIVWLFQYKSLFQQIFQI